MKTFLTWLEGFGDSTNWQTNYQGSKVVFTVGDIVQTDYQHQPIIAQIIDGNAERLVLDPLIWALPAIELNPLPSHFEIVKGQEVHYIPHDYFIRKCRMFLKSMADKAHSGTDTKEDYARANIYKNLLKRLEKNG